MFERFVSDRTDVEKRKASISKIGRIALNEYAVENYGLRNAKFVALYFDRDTNRAGLEFLTDKTENGVLMVQQRKNAGLYLIATAFLKKFDVMPTETFFCGIEQDKERKNFIILDLNKTSKKEDTM